MPIRVSEESSEVLDFVVCEAKIKVVSLMLSESGLRRRPSWRITISHFVLKRKNRNCMLEARRKIMSPFSADSEDYPLDLMTNSFRMLQKRFTSLTFSILPLFIGFSRQTSMLFTL